MDVLKASGEREPFDRDKLCRSLQRAGAPDRVVQKVCVLVEKELGSNASTAVIEKQTARYLAKEDLLLAARYHLRSAIMELGPAGFYFEEYIAAILREYGYKTTVGKMMKGHCLSHEIDILAEKENVHHIMELKYHNKKGLKTDAQVAMYAYARFLDIAAAHKRFESKKHAAWVVTNTKFTKSAVRYAACMNIHLLGWHYPRSGSLEQLIEKKSLYPVTVLPSASRFVKEQFAKQRMMFVRDLLGYTPRDLAGTFGLSIKQAQHLVQESYDLV